MNILNIEWIHSKKKIDENFAGSIWEKLGYSNELCPTCNAHIYNGICLNACHLSALLRVKFNDAIKAKYARQN